jgi:hypothetical protein
VNDLTSSIPKDGRSLAELLQSSEFDPEQWQVRRTGATIVLERIGEPAGIPPGFYTKATLPPLSEGARAILASVDAAVARLDAAKVRGGGDALEIEDAEVALELTDEPLPGIDPDR